MTEPELEPVVYGRCPCGDWARLSQRQDWTYFLHTATGTVHLIPHAPAVGGAYFTECPDCRFGGANPRAVGRMVMFSDGPTVKTDVVCWPCSRCRGTGRLPGFVMPA